MRLELDGLLVHFRGSPLHLVLENEIKVRMRFVIIPVLVIVSLLASPFHILGYPGASKGRVLTVPLATDKMGA